MISASLCYSLTCLGESGCGTRQDLTERDLPRPPSERTAFGSFVLLVRTGYKLVLSLPLLQGAYETEVVQAAPAPPVSGSGHPGQQGCELLTLVFCGPGSHRDSGARLLCPK